MSGWIFEISFQKQRNSIFIRSTSRRLDRASDGLCYNSLLRSNGTLEYSELLDIVRMCCNIIRTSCRDFPNSVDFWNPTSCWTMIDLAFRRCFSDVRTSSLLSVRHCGASGRLQRLVRMVAQELVDLAWNYGRTLHGHLLEACDQSHALIWTLSEYIKILNKHQSSCLKSNHYIKCFCHPECSQHKILTNSSFGHFGTKHLAGLEIHSRF